MNLDPITLSPEEFEQEVKSLLEAASDGLKSFEAKHRPKLTLGDGTYEIDVTVQFEALGAVFLVLVECKHQKAPVKRDVVQILHDRVREVGAHKGMLFATTNFQSGAIDYATRHGIALVQVCDGRTAMITKSLDAPRIDSERFGVPRYVGWLVSSAEGGHSYETVSVTYPEGLRGVVLGQRKG